MATGSVPASTARQDHERFIERQLDRTRRQVKMVELAAAGILLLVGVLVFFFVAALIDHWVLGLGTFGRFALLATLIGGIAWYAWTVLWPLLRNSINPAYAALTIEHSTPTLKNSLINFLMLRSHRNDVHEVVYEAVGQRAATDLQHVPLDSVVDYSKLIKVGYVLAAIFAVCAAYQILSPKDPLQTVARVAAPWADIARPSRVQIENVEPGDAQQYSGDQVTISAVIRGTRSSDRIVLRYSTADGQIQDQTVELTPDEAHHRFTTRIPRDGQGLQQDITYRIEAGDAVTRDYALTVVSAPTIVVEKLEYDFPAYTQKPRETRERTGDIRALEGTRVTVHAKANTPIQAAYLEFDPVNDHAPEATLQRQRVTLQTSGTSATGAFVLELQPDRVTPKFGTYQVIFVTASGQLGQHPALHTIDVIRDLPPEVEILAPRTQQIEVPENGEALVEVRAVDPDYALSHVGMKLTAAGRPLADKTLLTGPSQAGQAVSKFRFRPSEFKLRAGDEIAYWATAADNRTAPQTAVADPNTARTSNQFFKIVPADPNAKPPANPDQQQPSPADRPPMDGNASPDQPPQGEKGASDQRNETEEGSDANQQPMNEKGADKGSDEGETGDRPSDQQKPNDKSRKPEPGENEQSASDKTDTGDENGQQQGGAGADENQQPKDKPMSKDSQDQNQSGKGGGTNAGENEGEGNAAEQPQNGGKQPKGSNQAGGSNDQQKGSAPQDQGGGGKEQGGMGTGQDARESGQQKGADGSQPNAKPENSQGGSSGANESGERQPLHEGEAFEKALERMLEKARQEQGKSPQGDTGRDTQQQPSQEDIDKLPQHLKDRLQELLKQQPQQQQQPSPDGSGGQQQSQPGVQGDGNQSPQQNPPGPTGENQPGEGASGKPSKPAGADKKQGTGANNERSQGGSGQQEGGDNTRPEETSKTGEPQSEGERQGGMGQSGDAGAGRANEGNKGSPQAKKAGRDKPKSMQSNNEKPSEGNEATTASESKRQSDSEGGEGGERSGGGKQGGGQPANAAGNDSAGSNSAADEGAGAANQSGMGETAASAGDKQQAAGQTGQAGSEAGNGSTTQKDPRGDRTGQANQPNAGEQAPMQNKQPQPSGRDDREGSGQTGDFVTGGGKPSEQHGKSRFADAAGPAAEKARLDYAREATDLVLEYLKDQQDRPDQELLDDLGWTSEDLKQFLAKWEAAKRDAAVNPTGQRDLDEALRSLGLRPGQDKLRRGETKSDNVRGLGDVGPTSGPPSKYLEQFRAFKKGAARGN